MSANYSNLDEALRPVLLIIHADQQLGRLHHELVLEIERAQNEFDLGKTNTRSNTFSREPLSPAVKARYNTLREQLKTHHKNPLPEA